MLANAISILGIALVVGVVLGARPLVRRAVDVVRVPFERGQAAGDERLGQALRRLRQVVDDAEAAEALAEHAPLLDPELGADRLGVADDRVGPEVGQILGLVLRGHVRERPDRSRAAGSALVEEQQPVVLERALPPRLVDQLQEARRLETRPALEVDEPRPVVVLVRRSDDLAREDGDRRAARLRVVERQFELMLGEDEVRRAVGRDSHTAILLCRRAPRCRLARRGGGLALLAADRG